MSKDNMLLGYARGKVGSLVFARLKGQQVTRAHNAHPANPKTIQQMKQRSRLACIVAMYSTAVNKFYKFAFEDKKPVESDYNAFVRKNIGLAPWAAKEDIAIGNIPVAPIVMSSGSLAPFMSAPNANATWQEPTSGTFFGMRITEIGYDFAGFEVDEVTTVAQLSRVLVSASRGLLQDGDLLTAVCYYNEGGAGGVLRFSYLQFKIDFADTTSLGNRTDWALRRVTDAEFGERVYVQWDVPVRSGSVNPCVAYGVVVTRSTPSGILASDSELILTDSAEAPYETSVESSSADIAAGSFGVGQDFILSPKGKSNARLA